MAADKQTIARYDSPVLKSLKRAKSEIDTERPLKKLPAPRGKGKRDTRKRGR
jgi:hypothetical protein